MDWDLALQAQPVDASASWYLPPGYHNDRYAGRVQATPEDTPPYYDDKENT